MDMKKLSHTYLMKVRIMGSLKQLIFYLTIWVVGMSICSYGIYCLIKGKINRIALSYGVKRQIVSFKKNPRAAAFVFVIYLIGMILITIPMIISILIYLGIVR